MKLSNFDDQIRNEHTERMELAWPIVFYVCERHKEERFKGYEYAIMSEDELCESCNPRENDSLGG
jgi:hypothetical protein